MTIDPAAHIGLVRAVIFGAMKATPSWVDREELVSAGMLGLVEAAQRFDESKGVGFETYARLRIRGAAIDHLRKSSWFLKQKRNGDSPALLSLDKLLHEDDPDSDELGDRITEDAQYEPEHQVLVAERNGELADAIDSLRHRHQLIMWRVARHQHDPLVAAQLGVTVSRVCQIRAEACLVLRSRLSA